MEIPTLPTYALKVVDNSTGDADTFYVFAFKRDDIFFSHDTGNRILVSVGDEILSEHKLGI